MPTTDSKALARVKKHKAVAGGTANEGVWLSLDQLENLTTTLRGIISENGVHINAVAFMIGREQSGKKTVEILPFDKGSNQFLQLSGKLGALAGLPWNNEGGGGGGSQKTPPPSTP